MTRTPNTISETESQPLPIVVGVDGSASSREALLWAARQARLTGADIDLPPRGIVAVPAASPEFVLEDASETGERLEVIRITPNWPATTA